MSHEDLPGWDVTDEEMDQWAAEWEAVDREAGLYLIEALPELARLGMTPEDLAPATAELRGGVAGRDRRHGYFRAALGWEDGVPSDVDEPWLTALAATISPTQDPGTDPEEQAAVMALQHADWLGLVVGAVRRGTGAEITAEQAQRDIDALEDIDGEIEDAEGHLAVMTTALLTLTELWRTLGAVDEDDCLTELGHWGLPRALLLTWLPGMGAHRHIDPEIEQAALEILAREPMDLETLARTLAREQRFVSTDELEPLRWHDEVFDFADETFGHLPTLAEGLVLTHELTERELALGRLELGLDLDLWHRVADEGVGLAAGGEVTVDHAARGGEMPVDGSAALVGPRGWLDGFEAGDLVGLRYRGGACMVEQVAVDHQDPSVEESVRAVLEVTTSAVEYDAHHGDPSAPGVMGAEIVLRARALHPGSLSAPWPPLSALVAAAGFEVHHCFVGSPGTNWQGAPEWLTEEQRDTWTQWQWLLNTVATTGEVPADADLAELAGSLHGVVFELFAHDLAAPEAEPLVEAMEANLHGVGAAVPLRIRARRAEQERDGQAWLELLRAAHAADPGVPGVVEELADLTSVTGDAREAKRLYQLAGVEAQDDMVKVLRTFLEPPTDGPGRNRPCPCGSGKKYKLCHGRTATHPLPARVPWLFHKVVNFLQRPHQRQELLEWGALLAGTEPHEEAAVRRAMGDQTTWDFAIFEGGLLQRFLTTFGPLLPEDERELAESWVGSPLRLMEVAEVEPMRVIVAQDLLTEETLEIRDRMLTRTIEVKDVLLARPLDDADGALRLQLNPLEIPRMMRGRLLHLLREEAPAQQIAAALAPRSPEVRTTTGEEVVLSTARYESSDPDTLWTGLGEELEPTGDGGLALHGPGDVLMGTVERDGPWFVVRSNAVERLRALQAMLLDLDPAARLVEESTRPLESFDPDEGSSPNARSSPNAPELPAEAIEEIRRQVEDRWLADSIPALGGLTPREAAASPQARGDIVALLDDIEWTNRRGGNELSMDVGRLRRELGLE